MVLHCCRTTLIEVWRCKSGLLSIPFRIGRGCSLLSILFLEDCRSRYYRRMWHLRVTSVRMATLPRKILDSDLSGLTLAVCMIH